MLVVSVRLLSTRLQWQHQLRPWSALPPACHRSNLPTMVTATLPASGQPRHRQILAACPPQPRSRRFLKTRGRGVFSLRRGPGGREGRTRQEVLSFPPANSGRRSRSCH